jgi:hypothetical protein
MIQTTTPDLTQNLVPAIVAAGALGTAAFGIVEGLKSTSFVGEAGFSTALRLLGPLTDCARVAYGAEYETILRAQYRGSTAEFRRMLRQGIRVGLNAENAEKLAVFLGSITAAELMHAVKHLPHSSEAKQISDKDRSVIGRFELAADARVDAALTLAQAQYGSMARQLAMVVALGISIGTAYLLDISWIAGAIVGVAAVPIAPIAKDVASGISAAATALKARK